MLFCALLVIWEEKAECFASFVFLVSCDCNCSVALSHDDVGWCLLCVVDVFTDDTHSLLMLFFFGGGGFLF